MALDSASRNDGLDCPLELFPGVCLGALSNIGDQRLVIGEQ
jgi:hypothetical protein